ncbi:hypothetical protein Pelo_137 [Pelomyxa schiedti]|nr:hypothetical protein Pelo_137 [Pelomyxa schiedti]
MKWVGCERFNSPVTAKVASNWKEYLKTPDDVLCNAGVEKEPPRKDEIFTTYYALPDGGMNTFAFSAAPNPGVPQLPVPTGFLEIWVTNEGNTGQLCLGNIGRRNDKPVYDGPLRLRVFIKISEEEGILTPLVIYTAPGSGTKSTKITPSSGPSVISPRSRVALPPPLPVLVNNAQAAVNQELPRSQQQPQYALEGVPEAFLVNDLMPLTNGDSCASVFPNW